MDILFRPYMHVERLNSDEVEGILEGHCCISTKLDGTNTVVWCSNGEIKVGSRKREISVTNDNFDTCAYIMRNKDKYMKYFSKHPNYILYGEYLVKNAIKSYEVTAWRKYYVFDVYDVENDRYIPYEEYIDDIKECGIDFIPPIALIDNPSQEDLIRFLDESTFLNGDNPGEGIVIHNYKFKNKYGRTVFAKIVRKEFLKTKKEGHKENDPKTIEEQIIEHFVTDEFIEKEYNKLIAEVGEWNPKYIGRLLSTIWYTFINEEAWHIIKKYKNPIINFSILQKMVTDRIKNVKSDLFTGVKK